MLTAIDEKGNKVVAYNKTKDSLIALRHRPLFCPECKGKVILKAGQINTPHFAHKTIKKCTSQKGEGEGHLKGKLDLYHWFKHQGYPVELEHYLKNVNQRVDLLVKFKSKYLAVEYQCASISIADFINRTKGIYSEKLVPLWIFGGNYLTFITEKSFRWNAVLRSAVNFIDRNRLSKLFFYNSSNGLLTVISDIYSNKNRGYGHFFTKPLSNSQWKDVIHLPKMSKKDLFNIWLREKRTFRIGQRLYQNKIEYQYMNELYQRRLHPLNLPACIHLPVKHSHLFLIPSYKWQTKIILDLFHPMEIGEVIQWKEVWDNVKDDFFSYVNSSYSTPNVNPVWHYISSLEKLGYVKRWDHEFIIKEKHFKFPKSVDEALHEDEQHLRQLFLN